MSSKEVAGEGPYHLGAWYNAEEGTEEETIEGPGFPKGIDSFELTNEILNIAFAQGVSSQQARIKELTDETWKLGTVRDEAEARIRELEVELEARKKAWEELDSWLNICGADTGGGECEGMVNPTSVQIKMTALEATLPKGGA